MAGGDSDEKLELVKCFICESRDLLDNAEPQIIAMEEKALSLGKVDEEILNTIFRLFHSLKGSASFLDLQTVINVTHEAETLLDIFRKGHTAVQPTHVDLLIRTSDFIRNILDTVERQLNDEGFEGDAELLIQDLQKTISSISGTPALEDPAGDVRDTGSDGADLILNEEMTGRFVEENLHLLDEVEKKLLALEKTPGDLDCAGQIFCNLHTVKGNAGFFGHADLERVSHHAETLLDQIREGRVACDSVAISMLLVATDALREGLRQVEAGRALDIPGKEDLIRYLDAMCKNGQEIRHDDQSVQAGGRPGNAGSAGSPEDKARPATADSGQEQETTRPATANSGQEQETACEAEGGKKTADAGERRSLPGQEVIRVDIEKLDKLLDLVGELVIAEAMVVNNQDLQGNRLDRLEKATLQLDKITRDIQEVAMSMRMIPLAGTFHKMVRLVRDLAQKEDKKVSLEIIGDDTEVDKTIIEQISDPLVHLIRNAIDHGIEEPAERLARGKPETARLTLEAKHSAGEVWIIVEDDGRGLDREKIWRKGMQHGLIKGEAKELKDDELWRLIFEPGFSTADKVSNISGRGVGMDVVRRNIERLCGKVDIRSKPGSGTMFVVRIPLTLAIIEGMVVRVGNSRYTIPINSIKESLQPKAGQTTRTPDGLEVVLIRGDLVPVVRLHELYRVHPRCQQLTDGILIVVESNEKKCCLFVDEVIGQQQIVIKGLSSYLGHVRSTSGCAILGDGEVSLILDVADLVDYVQSMSA